ncbi:MAG: hypothetical protein IPH26_13555 [Sterolibacteriaceae bacterium]|uniref:Uncharacterized protein n=1 Tax=Candidatus Methylophosphatis roskildensis TaxID=2899263 RepID=A0A9D7DZR3_9PROT|nr:hypothetical protein [Candidatus Methylophosphatis roskildensis]
MDDEIRVRDGAAEYRLPDWASALIWLGAWCRSYAAPGKRLVAFAVLPTRDLAASFACLGSLIEGSRRFKDSLSWSRFRALPTGSVVFWKQPPGTRTFSGTVIGFGRREGSGEFIRIETKLRSKNMAGLVQEISEHAFDRYLFTVEQPPSANRTDTYRKAESFFNHLLGKCDPKWLWADGAEALVVTSIAKFELNQEGVSLLTTGEPSVALSDVLCIARNKSQSHSKIRISHPRGNIVGTFPLAILDGPEAFYVHEHLDGTSNILVVSDRSEYRADIHDTVVQLKGMAAADAGSSPAGIPNTFPPGIEISAFVIDAY